MTALGLGDHDNPAMSSPGSTGRPSTPCAIERSKTKLDTFTPKVLTQAGLAGQRLGVRDPISESPEKGVPIPIRGCGMDFGAPSLRTGRADFADPRLRNPACSLLGPRSMFRGAIGCFRHTQGGRRRRAGAGAGGARGSVRSVWRMRVTRRAAETLRDLGQARRHGFPPFVHALGNHFDRRQCALREVRIAGRLSLQSLAFDLQIIAGGR